MTRTFKFLATIGIGTLIVGCRSALHATDPTECSHGYSAEEVRQRFSRAEQVAKIELGVRGLGRPNLRRPCYEILIVHDSVRSQIYSRLAELGVPSEVVTTPVGSIVLHE